MDPHEVAVMAGVLVVRDRALEALDEAGFRPEHMATPRGTRALSAALAVWRRADPEAPVSRLTIEDAAGALAAPLLDAAGDAASEQGASVGTTLYAANALKAAYERRRAENALRVALGALRDGDPPHEVAEDVLEALGEIVNPPRDATVRLGDLVGEALKRLRNGGDAKTSTGLGDLDEVMRGGLQGGRLVIAAARPGVGKSALALRIADYVAATAAPTLMFG